MKQKDWRPVILLRKKDKFYSNKSRSPCTEEHWSVTGTELQVYILYYSYRAYTYNQYIHQQMRVIK
jgi:hypothetical protein